MANGKYTSSNFHFMSWQLRLFSILFNICKDYPLIWLFQVCILDYLSVKLLFQSAVAHFAKSMFFLSYIRMSHMRLSFSCHLVMPCHFLSVCLVVGRSEQY